MLRDGPHRDAFQAAAQATRARIRRERARAPGALKKVFTVLAAKLFHPPLNADQAWKAAGIRDHALRAVFKDATGTPLSRYIAAARIEVAAVLMTTTDLDLATISLEVGYTYHPTFAENYKRLKGKLPSQVEREPLASPVIDDTTSLKAGRGLLSEEELDLYLEDLLRIYPEAPRTIRTRASEDAEPEPRIQIDGARSEQLAAEGLWREIRDLPFDEQRRQVRRYLFGSTVLFDLLCKVSRRESFNDRRRGVELAELALVSLEGSDQVFGTRIHDLRALGWAWLGNAHRLALDFTAAAAAFEQADREWSVPRPQSEPLVLANLCCLKGVLRMMRRDYVAAAEALDRSCSLFQQSDQVRDEALALIHRGRVHIYAGKLREAIADLREAAGLIDEGDEKELAFAIYGNLANALVRAGQAEGAEKELRRARQLNREIEDPLGTPKLDWIEGDLGELRGDFEKARRLYLRVRASFRDADELRYFGMVSVDLMTIHSLLGDWKPVEMLASETLPILGSLSLHTETLAAVGLLAQAVEAQNLSRRLLSEFRQTLRQDPLAM